MNIELDYTVSVEQNAALHFDKAKHAKKKLQGVLDALEKTKRDLENARHSYNKSVEQAEQYVEQQRHKVRTKQWYEKFRWFYLPSGCLVVGGRDAHSNELLIKRYTDQRDIVFHTDMAGSPFFVVKSTDLSEQESCMVAQATAAYSRGWAKRLGSVSVFWVTGQQVSKQAQSGEHLSTGGFVVRGTTNYVRFDAMELAIGLRDGVIMGGPPQVFSESHVVVVQGDVKPGAAAKQIRSLLGAGDLDEIIRALPSGGVKLLGKRTGK